MAWFPGTRGFGPQVVQHALLLWLAVGLLVTSFTGNAGVQLVDRALAERLYLVHRHGVPGEAEYVALHGTWEGYVHNHCHYLPATGHGGPGPDGVMAASVLAGAAVCGHVAAVVAPVAQFARVMAARAAPPPSAPVPPLLRPPR